MIHVDITGRHVNVTPAIREFTIEKLSKLERLLDGPLEAHVVLGIEKHRHVAEIQVKSRNGIFTGHHATEDLYASIGDVAEKLERQALKHKEKLHAHKHRRGHRQPEIAAVIAANAAAEVAVDTYPEPPAPRGISRGRFCAKPMTLEDAVIQLDLGEVPLVMFEQADSGRAAAISRTTDGDIYFVEFPDS
jgi:putative sigma-54 modulation protein